MNIGVVIVTYGNRKDFLLKSVLSVIHNAVCKVIVVDNACTYDVQGFLTEHLAGYSDNFLVLHNHTNKGSAGGVYDGLHHILHRELDIKHILLLDDDNVLDEQGLDQMILASENIKKDCRMQDSNFCIMGHREYISRNLSRYVDANKTLYPKNDFLSFDLLYFVRKFFCSYHAIDPHKLYKIPYGFWGGLFFHRDVLLTHGLPNQKYYLYCDDVDFTIRFALRGGTIYYVPAIRIRDLEYSYGTNKVPNPLFDKNRMKIYYTIRNRCHIDRHLLHKQGFVYRMNQLIVLLGLSFLGVLTLRFKRLHMIFGAIHDGIVGKLGPKIGMELR